MGQQIEVSFYPKSRGGICIQCLGELVGRATILDLPKGDYSLKVKTRQQETVMTITVEE